ncbi:MAG: galactokinase [Candidatus Bathyarchaeota archaeon]
METELADAHRKLFGGGEVTVHKASGRVNLIGEHTDYNDGYVLPTPIDRHVFVASSPRGDSRVVAIARDLEDRAEFNLGSMKRSPEHPWSNYVMGVAQKLIEEGHRLRGADMVVGGDVPLGAGLSSSAALLVASLRAFQAMNGIALDPVEAAYLAKRAENEFVGVQCGVMDPFVATLGEHGKALFIDCRTNEHRHVALPRDHRVVIVNTMKSRDLASSAYNERRQQCMDAVQILSRHDPMIKALRDVSPETLVKHWDELPPLTRMRARHVVTENQRVMESLELLEDGDVDGFGDLMYDSHESLQNDYEVSCRELDVLVDATLDMRAVAGARMTGAGFGGCTVNLVEEGYVDRFTELIKEKYLSSTAKQAEVYLA